MRRSGAARHVLRNAREYRHQYANAEIAEELGIPKENIILKLNGEVFEMVEVDILTSKKTCYPVVLTGVRYGDGDTLDIQYSKDVNI